MHIIPIIIVLLVIGFAVYMFFTAPIPIHPWFKNLILGILFLALIIWALQLFGLHTGMTLRL